MPNTVLVCFTPDSGTVTGTDIRFVKLGESTLVGYGGRIGTKTVAPVFSDVVSSFVGDAVRVSK